MTPIVRRTLIVALAAGLGAGTAFAQGPPPQNPALQNPPPASQPRRQQRAGGRQALPPIGPNMNAQEVQKWLDTWALIEAERVLQLTQEQYPNFVARLTRLHNVRRRAQMERRRLLAEVGPLIQGSGPHKDEVIVEKLKALDDLALRAAEEIRQAYANLDGVLSPAQRARFRLFEEQIERRKIELLTKVRPGGGATPRGAGS